MYPNSSLRVALATAMFAALPLLPLAANADDAAPLSYSEAQLENGKKVYDRSCTACHGNNLGGSAMASPLVGFAFTNYWSKKPLSELHQILLEMPAGAPGSLSTEAYSDVLAYILSVNDYPAGDVALDLATADMTALLGAP